MNRGQIRSRVIHGLREEDVPVGWVTEEIDRYIDDEYRDLAEMTGAVVETTTISVQGGTIFAPLPTNCLFPLAVKDVTSGEPITPVHWTVIDGWKRRWNSVFRDKAEYYAPFGLHEIILFAGYLADSDISMMMAVSPDPFTSDSDEPNLPDEYHPAIVHKVMSRCIVKHAQDGPRIGRSLRHDKKAREVAGELELWTTSRHENIHLATYGTPATNSTPGGY